jgi:o-succinylbenzoate synthase
VATIDHVAIHRQTIPLRKPFVTAIRAVDALDVLLIEVRDGDGHCGWGEAPTSWRVTGESVEGVTAAVTGPLSEAILGLSCDDPNAASEALERAAVHNSSARMALDCAIFDLAAQGQGVALFEYLGGRVAHVRTDVTLSAVLSVGEEDALVRTALEKAREGFHTLKIKAGAGGDDVSALIAVRRAVGDSVALRVDANQAWTPQQALEIIGALEDAGVGVELIEQPVFRDDLKALAFVSRHSQTPIMADESIWTRRDLRDILRLHAVDMINIKLAKTGGLREALALYHEAHDAGVGVIIGCMAETHVGVGAAAALATVVDAQAPRDSLTHDLDGGLLLTRSPVRGGMTYDGLRVMLNTSPGAGIVALADTP